MRTFLRGKVTLLFMTFGLLLAFGGVALAAELVTSELDTVTPNDVTVTQGGSTNFNIGLTATGAISSSIISSDPSTAKVDTSYSLDSAGNFTASSPDSAAFKFFSSGTGCSGGGNCDVTWTGAPTPYSVGASISAASTTPVGNYTLTLSPGAGDTSVTNPSVSGGKLNDATPSTITVHVVAPPPPADTTPPVITKVVTGTLGNSGWYTSNVSVDWTVSDPESAISSQSGCGDFNVTSDQDATTYTCTATSAGGPSSESVTIKRDATDPTLAPSVSPNPVLLNGSATASANADDATNPGSGLASSSCDSVDTSSVGSHSVTCYAEDNAGNTNTANANYSVNYKFVGFSSPVDNPKYMNVLKAGQAIPFKWRLLDANDVPITTLSTVSLKASDLACSLGSTTDLMEEVAAGGSSLQNLGDGYYQFNWKSPTSYAKSCKTLTLSSTGLQQAAYFQFNK